ncbi:MAG: polysaccharide biosynthesis C-terminal domain-containing protein [Roseburia sp.]
MGNQKKNDSSFLVQGSILAAASLISRIIGLIYRIPMTHIIGNAGNSYYSSAYEIYNILLLISAYSLPTAVSKLVSARIAKGQKQNAYRIVKGALILASCTGLTASLILYFGAEALTTLFQSPLSIFALKILAPTVFVVAILGVIRGFFQGLGTMVPSAFSQVIEQVVNAVVSVAAAMLLYSYGARIGGVLGDAEKYGSAYGAAGGTLGTNLGAVAALLFVGLLFLGYKRVFKKQMKRDLSTKTESYGTIVRILLLTIIPVLLSTTIYNISSIIDLGIYKNVAVYQGYNMDQIDDWWGIFTGKYKTIINIPIAIASAMAASCVPNLTTAYASRRKKAVHHQIGLSIRFIMVIAFPCMVGVAVLASPILQLLYGDATETAAKILFHGSLAILFFTLSTLTNGLLQGINRLREPVKNAFLSLILHVIFLLVLMLGFDLNIYGVIYANTFFAFCMCVLNARSLRKYSGYRQKIRKTYLIPAISSAIMGVAVYFCYQFIQKISGINAVSTLVSIVIGILIYVIMMLLLRGLGEEELSRFPKGAALVRFFKKLHLLR